jgi:transposase
MLLPAFYSIRSERQLMERQEFDLLFRWFLGLGVDGPVWGHSSLTKTGIGCWRGRSPPSFWRQC